MRKLNRKGYLAVELILASTMAFAISFFLFDITMSLANKTNDAYVDTLVSTDKALVVKNIREKLNSYMCEVAGRRITSITCSSSTNCLVYFSSGGSKSITLSSNNTISYDGYVKKLNGNLHNVSLSGKLSGNYAYIKITSEDIFVSDDYDINIVLYNGCNN